MNLDVAIVGYAGRFPGARDVAEFWANLRAGVESIHFASAAELAAAGIPAELARDPRYVPAHGELDQVDGFDAGLFGFTPREAEVADPQQRLFLECCWEALEHAGYNRPEGYAGAIGVYAGVGLSSYLLRLFEHRRELAGIGAFQATNGNDKDALATRASYKLDLHGPAVGVQTACSTSLVAVHLACQGLLSGDCDAALAGGVSLRLPVHSGYVYQEGGILSPDGRCRAFDAGARGTVGGNGCGVVVLKRLADAVEEGDTVHAVIRGSAINNDGARKVGYTAPGGAGQEQVIARALAAAGVEAESVGYVEAHGTGTELGDPIEVAALTRAFRRSGARGRGFCALGSVKTNIGHLDAAAGVAGLLKAVLAVEHGEIPPSLHYRQPNPKIDFAASPFFVNTGLAAWVGAPRRAGVSSFGIGGTNAHVVLEQAPARPASGPGRGWEVLALSARSEESLDAAGARLAGALAGEDAAPLADVAFTLSMGRRALGARRAVVCRSAAAARQALGGDGGRAWSGTAGPGRVGFVFPGQGAQAVGMGRELYETEPAFREALAECAEGLRGPLGRDLRDLLWGEGANAEILAETRWAQPALFAVEVALARLWQSWGVEPEEMLGHSVGEYVAAVLGGLFTLPEALGLVAERGRLMQEAARGAMLAVGIPAAEAAAWLGGSALEVAVDNGPGGCVVGGGAPEIAGLAERLQAAGVWCRRLATSHAFHTAAMGGAAERFADAVAAVARQRPRRRWVSNLTGGWIDPEEVRQPAYWSAQLARPVRFGEGLRTLLGSGVDTVLEAGPGQTLSALVKREAGAAAAVPSLAAESETEGVLSALGRLWVRGVAVDWRRYWQGQRRHRVPLPTYPFERQRYWLDLPDRPLSAAGETAAAAAPAPGLWAPAWEPAPPLRPGRPPEGERWLVLADAGEAGGLGAELAERLRGRGAAVDLEGVDGFESEDFARVLGASGARQVVLLATGPGGPADEVPGRDFWHLVHLGQALGRGAVDGPVRLQVVTRGLEAVEPEDAIEPARGLLVGPARVLPQEVAGVSCRLLDVGRGGDEEWLAALTAELVDGGDEEVACRGGRRWRRSWRRLAAASGEPVRLRQQGVYLITGGLGALGLRVAEELARTVRARLVLVGRGAEVPPAAAERLRRVEELGGEVLVAAADVADRAALGRALAAGRERFGPLNGVVHAAGVAGVAALCPLSELRAEPVAAQLRPKVLGTLALAELLEGEALDFAVLFSSLSSALGGIGFAAYAGANGFLDAWAEARRARGDDRWISIGWDAWELDPAAPADPARPALRPEEGLELFHRALAAGRPRVLAVAGDLPARAGRAFRPRRPVRSAPRRRTSDPPPPGSVAAGIAEVWTAVLGVAEIGLRDGFFALGGDSLAVLQMIAGVKRRFGVDLPLRSVLETPTLAALAALVEARQVRPPKPSPGGRSSLVARLREGGPGPAVVCIHPVGGTVFGYRALAQALPAGTAVWGVRASGAEAGEPFLATIEEMAERYVEELAPVLAQGPAVLAGSSMGGVVAFEMGQRLGRAGAPPLLVALFDTPGPRAWPRRFADDAEALVTLLGDDLPLPVEELRGLTPEGQLARVLAEIAAREIRLPLALGPEDARRFLALFKENSEAMWRYVPAPYEGRLAYFRAAGEAERGGAAPESDWASLAPGGLELHVTPGGHRTMLDPPHVSAVASRLARALAPRAADRTPGEPAGLLGERP